MIKTWIILLSIIVNLSVYGNTVEHGKASWYSTKCNGGTATSSGQKLDNNANTVAHKTLPMGTQIKITNLKNNKSVVCVVTDKGPSIPSRIVDVTIGVAKKLGFVKQGITTVRIEVVGKVKIK